MKPTPQQSRSKATVERLLAAANDEFALHGVSGATTTSIADRAGVSVGSLYRFFGDKQALAEALSDQYLEAASAVFAPVLAAINGPDDLVGALRKIVRGAADLQREHPGYYRITQDVVPDLPGSPGTIVRTRLVDVFAAVLDELEIGPSPEVRRRVVNLTTETVRHTLAVIGPKARDRDEQIYELEQLAVGYFVHRLGLEIAD